ncbi:hypothetical protein [Ralstonia pseudosolanacearum]|uniref:hypothetical protein n=1 Tax=Ralstonia pseudosolanacearum TaxID=1310165 RepID=UPI0032217E63
MAIFHHRFFCRILNAKKKPATGGQLKQECDAICRHLGHLGMGVYAYRIKLHEIRCMPENHFQIVLCSIYVGLEFSTVIRSIFDWVLVSSNAACGGGL